MSRDSYQAKRDIYLIDVNRKEDIYMNLQLFNYIIKNTQYYNQYLLDLKENLKNNISEKDNIYVSNGRPILKIEFNKKIKPKSFLCLTSKNINKIIKNKTRKKL